MQPELETAMNTDTSFPFADDDNAAALLPPLRDPLFGPLRAELDGLDTPPGVRKELLAAFARQQASRKAARPWWRRWPALTGGGAALAAVLVCVMLAQWPALMHPMLPVPAGSGGDDHFGAFIALDTLERIEQDPAPRMLATSVPRSSLVSLGVAVDPEDAGDMVQAQMLVGADGSPLALRLALQ